MAASDRELRRETHERIAEQARQADRPGEYAFMFQPSCRPQASAPDETVVPARPTGGNTAPAGLAQQIKA